jgi:FKBP-type peptidyl-prolyl cis-trans isomerase
VTVTESGLQYEIIEAGDGPVPGADDTVEVHYRGTLVDGTEFDSSYSRGQTVQFGVGQVISGWTEALQLMPAGSKWKLVIPPELGYGSGGAGQMIGPNAALIFEVELVSIPSQQAGEAAEPASEG